MVRQGFWSNRETPPLLRMPLLEPYTIAKKPTRGPRWRGAGWSAFLMPGALQASSPKSFRGLHRATVKWRQGGDDRDRRCANAGGNRSRRPARGREGRQVSRRLGG